MRSFDIREQLAELSPGSILGEPGSAIAASLTKLIGRASAERIIATAGVVGAYRMSSHELAAVAQIPLRVAERVTAAREFAVAHVPADAPIINTPTAATAHVPAGLAALETEVLLGLVLGARFELKGTVIFAKGNSNFTSFAMRDVLVPLVRLSAHAFVLIHNHPERTPVPSEDDIMMTNRVAEAAELLGIVLVDHLIVAGTEILSFAALGLLPGTAGDTAPSSSTRRRRPR